MQTDSEERYQIATLVVVVLIVLAVVGELLIFVNPQIALNPFKPLADATPTVVIAAVPTFPPTWTPEPTQTPVPSPTPSPTQTDTPTRTPTTTHTPVRPTPLPAAAPTSALPAAAPAGAAAPTPLPLPYSYKMVIQSCTHSGSAVIKGKVTSGGSPGDGVHVRLGTSSDPSSVQEEQTAHLDGTGSAVYAFIVPPPDSGSFAWHVWVADSDGNALSDPNMAVTLNTLPADDPSSCWLALVDFVK